LFSGRGTTISEGNPVVVGVLAFHVVAVGANEPPVLRHMGESWLKLPSPLDAMRTSSAVSSIRAHSGVDASL
jgi:hypothetical protein